MIPEFTRHVGILSVYLHIPSAQSLKDKRMVIKSLKERIKNRFNVSVAELDGQDKWQVAVLGIVMISNDQRFIDSNLESILNFIAGHGSCEVCEHKIELG